MPEYMVSIKIEKLDEGAYLATSDVLPGLVAEGRTIAETMEIAQDVARKIIRIQDGQEYQDPCGCDLMAKLPALSAIEVIRGLKKAGFPGFAL